MGYGEIRFLKWYDVINSNSWFLAILKEFSGLPLFKLIFSSLCYPGCMVVNINAIFAQWRIAERDYFQILLLGILSDMEPTSYLFSDIIDAATTTFNVLVNTYFLDSRLALLVVLRALVHVIYLVIFNNFLVFNFPFLISNNNFLFPG